MIQLKVKSAESSFTLNTTLIQYQLKYFKRLARLSPYFLMFGEWFMAAASPRHCTPGSPHARVSCNLSPVSDLLWTFWRGSDILSRIWRGWWYSRHINVWTPCALTTTKTSKLICKYFRLRFKTHFLKIKFLIWYWWSVAKFLRSVI